MPAGLQLALGPVQFNPIIVVVTIGSWALGPVEASGMAPLEAACAEAGFRRGRAG
jgi:hypothetical protein